MSKLASTRLVISIAIFFVAMRLWLSSIMQISAEPGQFYDDGLYVNLAVELLAGNWLGNYNNLTLIKGPGYPLWLAFNSLIGTPLLLSQSILYVISSALLTISLRSTINNKPLLLLLFILLLFNPFIETRVMREGIYPSLFMLVCAGFIGIYSEACESKTRMTAWSALAGFSLLWFWITREEGIWIFPLVLLLILATSRSIHSRSLNDKFSRYFIVFAPVLIAILGISTLALINFIYYGKFINIEIKDNPLLSAYGALTRVSHEQYIRYLDVPKEVRYKIYAVSPAFAELKPYLDEGRSPLIESWKKLTCGMYPKTCGDIGGNWMMWAFRDAVFLAGYHTSASQAAKFYEKVAAEVNTACDNGFLSCGSARSSLATPLRRELWVPFRDAIRSGAERILSLPVPPYAFENPASHGTNPKDLMTEKFLAITHGNLAPEGGYHKSMGHDPMQSIIKIYRYLLGALYYVVPIYYLLILTKKSSKQNIISLLITGTLLSVMLRLGLLAFLDVTSFPTLFNWTSYLVPFYPPLLLLLFLFLFEIYSRLTAHDNHKLSY